MTLSKALTQGAYFDSLRQVAIYASHYSPDPSSQNGACLAEGVKPFFGTFSVNEFPNGVLETEDRWQRPRKYRYVEHAERNAIYAAANQGTRTVGLTMICLWAACTDCARGIIQAGIQRLVTLQSTEEGAHEAWDEEIRVAMGMLEEAGVEVVFVDGPLGVEIRRNGADIRV